MFYFYNQKKKFFFKDLNPPENSLYRESFVLIFLIWIISESYVKISF